VHAQAATWLASTTAQTCRRKIFLDPLPAYLPSNSFKIVPLIVAYAKEESRFSGTW
jgi:hypothetical protein